MNVATLFWLLSVTAPHVLYIFSYHYGPTLNQWIPHAEFVQLAIVLRIISIAATAWLFRETCFFSWEIYDWLSPFPFPLVGFLLILFGLQINIAVYQKLGASGVYYACEMIQKCKVIQGYPFDVLKHPMYVASGILLMGVLFFIGIDEDYEPRWEVILPLIYMMMLYLFTTYVEDFVPIQKNESILKIA